MFFGVIAGYTLGRLLNWAESRKTVEENSSLARTLALSLGVLSAGKLLGTDGILAVFVAGMALDMAMTSYERQGEERVQEAVNRFFTLPIFVLFGVVLALHPLLGSVDGVREGLFLGWFGPIGVAALFYANFSLGHTGYEEMWTNASLLIAASVLAHGLTPTPLTRLYGRG